MLSVIATFYENEVKIMIASFKCLETAKDAAESYRDEFGASAIIIQHKFYKLWAMCSKYDLDERLDVAVWASTRKNQW